MNASIIQFAPLAGRVLISAIFLLSGIGKIGDWSGTAAYMAGHGMPAAPFFLFLAIAIELAGGLSVLTGFKARWGALLLFVFLIPTTLIFHAFWAAEPEMFRMQMTNFMKNLAIMGGLLQIIAHGSGALSLDRQAPATE